MTTPPMADKKDDETAADLAIVPRASVLRAEQEKAEEEARRQKEIRDAKLEFERGVYITKITSKDLDKLAGLNWRSKRIKYLDFSAEHYKLESLHGLDDLLDRSRLTYLGHLDLTDNRLHNIDWLHNNNGLDYLLVLVARRNMVNNAKLQLKRLIELNLAHNVLSAPPDLYGMPNLEVLNLSHNHLKGSFQAFKAGARLKQLDLAYNQYECTPTELARGLECLSLLKSLATFRMYGNPFIACFKEYQIFVVKRLTAVTKLDDLNITRNLRRDIAAANVQTLEAYDDAYRERKKALNMADAGKKKKVAVHGFSRLACIIRWLEDIADDPSSLQQKVADIVHEATVFTTTLSSAGVKGAPEVEETFWSDVKAPRDDYEAVVNRVVEMMVGTMERHESVRYQLIETLGHLTAVTKHSFGAKCMGALGRIMLGNESSRGEAAKVFQPIVLNNFRIACEQDIMSPQSKALVEGLNAMMADESIIDEVAGGMKDLLPKLVKWMTGDPAAQQPPANLTEGRHLVKLIAYLTETEENAKTVANNELAARCIDSIDNKSIANAVPLRDLYSDILNLAENLIVHGPDHVIDKFVTESTHVKVISKAVSTSQSGRFNDPQEAELLAKIFNFVAAMMERKQVVLHDCCESFHIIEVLCKFLTMHNIDPKILASACRCLTLILKDEEMYGKHAGDVVDSLQMVVPMLEFLNGKRFPDLYKRAMRHDADEKTLQDIENDNIEIPPLTHMNNALVCEAFKSIIELVSFFADEPEDRPADPYKTQVNEAMSKNNREQVLLRLLPVPSDEIKCAVMQCITNMPVNQISAEEMGMVIKSISDCRNIGEGDAEKVLGLLVKLLGRLVQDKKETGLAFRTTYAQIAIAEVFETLMKNSERHTHGDTKEEEQKLALSIAIVDFLRSCGQVPSLRRFLRSAEICRRFATALKLEEELHTPFMHDRSQGHSGWTDVSLEQTWIGRSLENLLDCLKGTRALEPKKKVMFRLLSRAADVLEGHTDAIRPNSTLSVNEIMHKETVMWPNKETLERQHRYMDDTEWSDRMEQAVKFISLGGLGLIREQLSGLAVRTAAGKNESEMIKDEAGDLERIRAGANMLEDVDDAAGTGRNSGSGSGRHKEKVSCAKIPGREALMRAIQRHETAVDSDKEMLFASRPSVFDCDNEFDPFDDASKTQLCFVWPLSSYFRILHSLLVVPPTDDCFTAVVQDIMDPKNLLLVMAMIEQVPCLACNIVAKFLRLMHCVIRAVIDHRGNPHTTAIKCPRLRTFKLISKFVCKHAEWTLPLMRLTKERCLERPEEVLALEMARFMDTLIVAAPILFEIERARDVASSKQQSLAQGTSSCVEVLVKHECTRLFVQTVLYELQMDAGGGNRGHISLEFMRASYNRLHLKEMCLQTLAHQLVAQPEVAYEVLEMFSDAEVFEGLTVRPCIMTDLLQQVSLGKYQEFCQGYLREKGHLDAKGHILHFELADVLTPGLGPAVAIVCITTQRLFLLAPSSEMPAASSGDPAGEGWDPSWEDDRPRIPRILAEHEYTDLERLYRCMGSQLLAIHFKTVLNNDEGVKVKKGKFRGGFDGTRYYYCGRSGLKLGQAFGRCGPEGGPQCDSCRRFQQQQQATDQQNALASMQQKAVGSGAIVEASAAAAAGGPGSAPTLRLMSFHRLGVRDMCAQALKRLSAPFENERVQVVSDPVIRREVLECEDIKGAQVLAVTVGLPASISQGRRAWKRGPGIPHLFVLTDKAAADFTIDFSAWSIPSQAETFFDDADEFTPQDLYGDDEGGGASSSAVRFDGAAAPGAKDVEAGPLALMPYNDGVKELKDDPERSIQHHRERVVDADLAAGHGGREGEQNDLPAIEAPAEPSKKAFPGSKERSCGFSAARAQSSAKNTASAATPVLNLVKSHKLPFQEVSFEVGPKPELGMKSGEGALQIRFFDDAGRESWRRALTYVTSRSGKQWKRNKK